jgi:hypothetical protein
MTPDEMKLHDFGFLYQATVSLLGYFVHRTFADYLTVITASLRRWHEQGLIRNLAEPTVAGEYTMLLDFRGLDIEKVTWMNGVYFYILACHKGANFRMMNRYDGKQVLYLRGYDFESALAFGGELAAEYSSVNTSRFNAMLARDLSPYFKVFKILSPKDVEWEARDVSRHFYGDFGAVIRLARQSMLSVYANASRWKDDVNFLLDRMDHFVVYVSSQTESALWEIRQLDTDERRGRVTIVFDEEAIQNKEAHVGFQDQMEHDPEQRVIWKKEGPAPRQTAAELRDELSRKFLVTTPDAFEKDIEEHRRRISGSSARLGPGDRETWLDFRFSPAIAEEKLGEIREYSHWVQSQIDAAVVPKKITCLPLFLNLIQLRVFMTLLMGEHDETGRALAGYAAVIQGAIDHYGRPGHKACDLSEENSDEHIEVLKDHFDMANCIGVQLLASGKSNEFGNYSAEAVADFNSTFVSTKAAVADFFEIASARG